MKIDALRIKQLRAEGKSLNEIVEILALPKSTVYYWTKQIPLTDKEKQDRNKRAALKRAEKLKSWRNEVNKSKHYRIDLSKADKGKLAEAAILFRLVLNKFDVSQPVFGGSKHDWIVLNSHGKLLKIQVRFIRWGRCGRPAIPLVCSNGRGAQRRYTQTEFDYIVGYDLYTDTAYIYSTSELSDNKATVSIDDEHAEKWDLLNQ